MRNDNLAAPLDIDAVRNFTRIADLANFTRAAEAAGTTQSAVSLKLKRLEQRLSVRLIERTPRSVRLTAEGAAFLPRALALLSAHDHALRGDSFQERRLTIGLSDHVAGPDLPRLIASINAFDPALVLDVRIGFSTALLDDYDAGTLDAVIVRREGSRRGGEPLLKDTFGWFGSPNFQRSSGRPLPLAMLAAPCGVRTLAIRALDRAGIKWVEAFTGGGVTAVTAAIAAGLAISPLARRIAPPETRDFGRELGLPALGPSHVIMYSRLSDASARAALRTLAAAFRGSSSR